MAAQPGRLGAAVKPEVLNGDDEVRPRRLWGEGEMSRLAVMRELLAAHELDQRRRPAAAKWRDVLRAVVAGLRGLRGKP